MARKKANKSTSTPEPHLLGIRLGPASMKKLDNHCKRLSLREQRRVSYREAIEDMIKSSAA